MYNGIARALALSLLLTCSAFAADHVLLTNGDSVTGSIVKKDGDTLTVKSDLFGVISMSWKAVKSITSDAELNVVLPGGNTVKGKLSTAGDQLQVATPTAPATAPLASVTAVRDAAEQHNFERMIHPGLWELWSGNFDIGFAAATGNARSENLTTSFTSDRITRTDKISTYFTQIYSTARANNVSTTIASAVRGGWKYNRSVSHRMFVTGFNDYEHDRFQDLSLRFVAGGGAGVNAVKSERTQLDFDAGIDYQREIFMSSPTRNSAEFNFGDSLLWKMSKVTSVTQSARVFTNLTDTGAYRANFDLGTTTVLRKWLGWHFTVSDRFVSNPVLGRQRNDLLISTGLRLTFNR